MVNIHADCAGRAEFSSVDGADKPTDTTRHLRFARNPLVINEPYLRFYAGAVLRTPTGTALGTICVLDQIARGISSEQKNALRILSKQVMAHLEFRKRLKLSEETNVFQTEKITQLELALSATKTELSLLGRPNNACAKPADDQRLAVPKTLELCICQTGTAFPHALLFPQRYAAVIAGKSRQDGRFGWHFPMRHPNRYR